jgi:alpha-maltose-1-phosphate synthase
MKVALLTREYPPEVYGGAGVHVEHLAAELARLVDVEVRCFGADRGAPTGPGTPAVLAFRPWGELAGEEPYRSALGVMSVDLAMAAGLEGFDVAHSHTWYANFAGHLAKLLEGLPHVMTMHSLEPLRPWKLEQLGVGGYSLSRFCERTAVEAADGVIAVSGAMRADILRAYPAVDPERVEVVHNGIDPQVYRPDSGREALQRYDVSTDRPLVVFIGRITRQKGITHLAQAALSIDPEAQVVLVAGAPDNAEIEREVAEAVERVRRDRGGIVWIDTMIERREIVQLLTHARVFVCPSVYEPLGIVNLEAMACQTAVVATDTGGIPEVVDDGVTGLLVPFDPVDDLTWRPRDPDRFAHDLAARVNELLRDPDRAREMGRAGRRRVLERFTWSAVAERTLAVYRRTLEQAALKVAEAAYGADTPGRV